MLPLCLPADIRVNLWRIIYDSNTMTLRRTTNNLTGQQARMRAWRSQAF